MFNVCKFIFSNKEYDLLFKNIEKEKTPDLENKLSKIKEFKSNFQKYDYNDLKLLKADIESKLENDTASGLIKIVIAALIGMILDRLINATIGEFVIFVLALILIGINGASMILKRAKWLFIKKIIDICLEEKKY